MKGHVNTKNGEISIENQVIAKYAGICALGCFGIVGMAMVNMKDGIAKLLTRDNIRKGVFVSVKNNKITIDFHIIVSYSMESNSISSYFCNIENKTMKYKKLISFLSFLFSQFVQYMDRNPFVLKYR